MREPIEPFASVGTSNVFFQVVLGNATTKDIAKHTDTQPPSVAEHLNRLRELGILKRSEKEGKLQPYEVDWERFVHALFRHIYTPKLQRAALQSMEDERTREELEREQKLMKEIIAELKRNKRFMAVVRGYFERLAKDMEEGLYPRRTIWGAIYCFEESLDMISGIIERTKDPETRKLLELLKKWNCCRQRFRQHGPRAAFERSVRRVDQAQAGAG